MATTVAIGNQKGGTGKTTTTLNLGVALVERGRRVALIDMDPQASLSISLGVENPPVSIADVLGDHRPGTHKLSQIVRRAGNGQGRLFLVPSDITLASAALGMERRIGRELLLKNALQPLKADYVLIDCPPDLGVLTINSLVAADQVLIPVQAEYLAYRGLALFWQTLQLVAPLNPQLKVLGVLPTMVRNTNHHKQILKQLQDKVQARVFEPVPQSIRASEAHLLGRAVIEVYADNSVAKAYKALALEVDREW
jgi:chromosome partitioning protein